MIKKRVFDAQGVSGLNHEAWERWLTYRSDVGAPVKQASIEAAAKRLAKLGDRQAEAVETSMANGWQGLFEPHSATNRTVTGAANSGNSEASARFEALIRSEGADRTERDQRALKKIGGWSVIRHRTPYSELQIRRAFIDAYHSARDAANGEFQPVAPKGQT